jgi:hypothetical protein
MLLRMATALMLGAAIAVSAVSARGQTVTPTPAAPQTPSVAQAANGSYVVTGVAVETTGATAAAARDEAFVVGQREALRILLGSLEVDPSRADTVARGDLEAMVERFQVLSEQTAPGRYTATLGYTFRASAVDALLGSGPAGTAALTGAPNAINVLVPVSGSAEWFQVQSRLSRLPPQITSTVVSLSASEVVLEIRFPGDQGQLVPVLAQVGLTLQQGTQALELRQTGGL